VGPAAEVVEAVLDAHAVLAEAVEDDMGCKFAEGKTAVLATSRAATAALARRIGVGGGVAQHACILGVDNAAGRERRGLRAGSRRAARLKKALARRTRLEKLDRVIGRKALTIYRAGVELAAAHDSPIWGVSDAEAMRLRRLAAATMSPHARGRSLTMLHLWNGLPTATAELGPLLQFSRMVWKAVVAREDACMRNVSLADIRGLWESATATFLPIAEQVKDARVGLEAVPRGLARRAWRRVKGPIAAAALTLARIGWRFDGPFELVTDEGATITLTVSSPAMVKSLAREGMRRELERALGVKWALTDQTYVGRRVCVDLAVQASRPGSRLSPCNRTRSGRRHAAP
jgi:hypothetical protein